MRKLKIKMETYFARNYKVMSLHMDPGELQYLTKDNNKYEQTYKQRRCREIFIRSIYTTTSHLATGLLSNDLFAKCFDR